MGAALLGVLGARLRPGIEIVTIALGLEAAVAEGATIVRVGTALFGGRTYPA